MNLQELLETVKEDLDFYSADNLEEEAKMLLKRLYAVLEEFETNGA